MYIFANFVNLMFRKYSLKELVDISMLHQHNIVFNSANAIITIKQTQATEKENAIAEEDKFILYISDTEEIVNN